MQISVEARQTPVNFSAPSVGEVQAVPFHSLPPMHDLPMDPPVAVDDMDMDVVVAGAVLVSLAGLPADPKRRLALEGAAGALLLSSCGVQPAPELSPTHQQQTAAGEPTAAVTPVAEDAGTQPGEVQPGEVEPAPSMEQLATELLAENPDAVFYPLTHPAAYAETAANWLTATEEEKLAQQAWMETLTKEWLTLQGKESWLADEDLTDPLWRVNIMTRWVQNNKDAFREMVLEGPLTIMTSLETDRINKDMHTLAIGYPAAWREVSGNFITFYGSSSGLKINETEGYITDFSGNLEFFDFPNPNDPNTIRVTLAILQPRESPDEPPEILHAVGMIHLKNVILGPGDLLIGAPYRESHQLIALPEGHELNVGPTYMPDVRTPISLTHLLASLGRNVEMSGGGGVALQQNFKVNGEYFSVSTFIDPETGLLLVTVFQEYGIGGKPPINAFPWPVEEEQE